MKAQVRSRGRDVFHLRDPKAYDQSLTHGGVITFREGKFGPGAMSDIVSFRSEEGGVVLVEVANSPGGQVMRGGRTESAVVEAGQSIERTLGQLGPVRRSIVSEVRANAEWPNQVEVEFAVKISADSNIIIARTGGEANFSIALRWSGAESGDQRAADGGE